jgi:hypothetical protein
MCWFRDPERIIPEPDPGGKKQPLPTDVKSWVYCVARTEKEIVFFKRIFKRQFFLSTQSQSPISQRQIIRCLL